MSYANFKTLLHISVIALLVFLFYILAIYIYRDLGFPSFSFKRSFSFHPTFMALGIIFFVYGVFSYQYGKPSQRKFTHMVFQTVGLLCFGAAFAGILKSKIDQGRDNFQTTHSILGLVLLISVLIQYLVSLLAFYFLELPAVIRKAFCVVHSIFGITNILLMLVVSYIGISGMKSFSEETSKKLWVSDIVVIIIIAFLTVEFLTTLWGKYRKNLSSKKSEVNLAHQTDKSINSGLLEQKAD